MCVQLVSKRVTRPGYGEFILFVRAVKERLILFFVFRCEGFMVVFCVTECFQTSWQGSLVEFVFTGVRSTPGATSSVSLSAMTQGGIPCRMAQAHSVTFVGGS